MRHNISLACEEEEEMGDRKQKEATDRFLVTPSEWEVRSQRMIDKFSILKPYFNSTDYSL